MWSVCALKKVRSLTCSNGVFGDTFTVCLLPFGVKTDTAAPLAAMTPWRHRCLVDKTLCVFSASPWRHTPYIFFFYFIFFFLFSIYLFLKLWWVILCLNDLLSLTNRFQILNCFHTTRASLSCGFFAGMPQKNISCSKGSLIQRFFS